MVFSAAMLKLTTNSAGAIREQHGNADLKELVLQLHSRSDWTALDEALRLGFPSIKRVKVICSRDHRNQHREWGSASFWQSIGTLGNLKDLELANFSGDFPVRLIASILEESACQLERLLLHQVYLITDRPDEELPKLTRAIQQQRNLKSFDLCGFFKMERHFLSTKICSAVVIGLSALPALESVFIDSDRGFLEHEPFEQLCQSSSLQKLHFRDVYFANGGNISIARALGSNSNLKELRLYNRQLQAKDISAFFQMLRSHVSLEYFRLWTRYTSETKDAELDLANALAENKTLKRCHFFHVDIGDEHVERNGKAFAAMLETNLTLTHMTYSRCMTSAFWPKIKLFLELNANGRRRLTEHFATMTRGEWVRLLSEATDKLDYLFHFLLLNPLICQND